MFIYTNGEGWDDDFEYIYIYIYIYKILTVMITEVLDTYTDTILRVYFIPPKSRQQPTKIHGVVNVKTSTNLQCSSFCEFGRPSFTSIQIGN